MSKGLKEKERARLSECMTIVDTRLPNEKPQTHPGYLCRNSAETGGLADPTTLVAEFCLQMNEKYVRFRSACLRWALAKFRADPLSTCTDAKFRYVFASTFPASG
jgi:hypothetical protein